MSDKPVVVYGASGYTGRLVCEYLREYNVPFVAAGRDEDKLKTSMGPTSPASRPPSTRWRGRAHRRGADRAVHRRRRRLQHRRPVQRRYGARGRRGRAGRRRPLPRHHRRAGLADHLRREVRRGLRRRRPAARPGHRADVHDRRDRRPALPRDARASTPSTSPCFWGGSPTDRLDADDPRQRRDVQGALPRAEHATSSGTPTRASTARRPRPARARAGPAVGRHVPPGVVPERPAGGQRQGPRRRVQPRAHARRAADRRRRARGDQGHGRRATATPRSTRPRPR